MHGTRETPRVLNSAIITGNTPAEVLFDATGAAHRIALRAVVGGHLVAIVNLRQSESGLQRAAPIQGCLLGSFSELWTILALQLDANCHLKA
jgi:hypothetical protein